MKNLKSILINTFIFLWVTGFSQKNSSLIEVTDLLKIKSVGALNLSKDGSKLAFTVTSIIPNDKMKGDYSYQTQIHYLLTLTQQPPQQLTFQKEGAAQPTWSPDGSMLAFVRRVDNKPQIFLLSMNGGEAQQLSFSKHGASNPLWSADGTKILYRSDIDLYTLIDDTILNPQHQVPEWSFEKPGFENNNFLRSSKDIKADADGSLTQIRAYLKKNADDNKSEVLDLLNFQNESQLSSDLEFSVFFWIDINLKNEPQQLKLPLFYNFNSLEILPDGNRILFSADYYDGKHHPNRILPNQILISDLEGNNILKILSDSQRNYSAATVSPNGQYLGFTYNTPLQVGVDTLAIIPINGSFKEKTIFDLDRNKASVKWSKDGQYLFVTAQSNGGIPLYKINITSKKMEKLGNPDAGIYNFVVSSQAVFYAKTQISNVWDVYQADLNLNQEVQRTKLNEWILTKRLSIPKKFSFKNDLGLEVEYWVMPPTNLDSFPNKKFPVILEIHGGPTAMWGPGEASMWHEYQYFCSRGYGVVYGNPRGSGGYGNSFVRANIMDWGKGPSKDVLTYLDKALNDFNWADKNNLFVTGGSYAGYLTAWIIGHDKRFNAACSQRGVYDLATFFGEGNAWRLVPIYFGGYPWEPKVKAVLQRESPITYVDQITTPYIIFHGANDRRTGFVQSEMMYRSLKVLNRPVEFVVHWGATHEITRSGDNRQRIDQMLRTFEFFERWLKK
ncbi:MAG: S9 family peptidase [Sediminibacterium sp.]|nr:S9 family peptidase [Sediminibacterium sp.]